jgi:hypothetical protein
MKSGQFGQFCLKKYPFFVSPQMLPVTITPNLAMSDRVPSSDEALLGLKMLQAAEESGVFRSKAAKRGAQDIRNFLKRRVDNTSRSDPSPAKKRVIPSPAKKIRRSGKCDACTKEGYNDKADYILFERLDREHEHMACVTHHPQREPHVCAVCGTKVYRYKHVDDNETGLFVGHPDFPSTSHDAKILEHEGRTISTAFVFHGTLESWPASVLGGLKNLTVVPSCQDGELDLSKLGASIDLQKLHFRAEREEEGYSLGKQWRWLSKLTQLMELVVPYSRLPKTMSWAKRMKKLWYADLTK